MKSWLNKDKAGGNTRICVNANDGGGGGGDISTDDHHYEDDNTHT